MARDWLTKYYFVYAACLGAIIIAIAFLLSSCITTVITERPPYYTRYEVDAITAESNCRALARNMLQMERCATRR
jgi:hypothetical protein